MSSTNAVAARTSAEYAVARSSGWVLVMGSIPVEDWAALSRQWASEGMDVVDSSLALHLDATWVVGTASAIEALRRQAKEHGSDLANALSKAADERVELDWLFSLDTGLSSEAMLYHLTEHAQVRAQLENIRRRVHFPELSNHPHDPADLGRCLRLLDRCPWLAERIEKMRPVSRAWASLVGEWPRLVASYRRELETPDGRATKHAPETYEAMCRILRAVAS